MKIQTLIALAVAWVVTIVATGFGGWLYGHTQGHAQAVQVCQSADIKSLTGVINQVDLLSKEANTFNLQLSNTLAQQQKQNQQTTQELQRALSTTSHLRVECVFDDRVMQLIHQAADRADHAAASGINGAVPAGAKAR